MIMKRLICICFLLIVLALNVSANSSQTKVLSDTWITISRDYTYTPTDKDLVILSKINKNISKISDTNLLRDLGVQIYDFRKSYKQNERMYFFLTEAMLSLEKNYKLKRIMKPTIDENILPTDFSDL